MIAGLIPLLRRFSRTATDGEEEVRPGCPGVMITGVIGGVGVDTDAAGGGELAASAL